jgi:transcriptional regulator with XRE-family HTH domain|tara:strand:- start:1562 stop:1834 length:273 start_codon:yes stop_codon:yes gene_type:complete
MIKKLIVGSPEAMQHEPSLEAPEEVPMVFCQRVKDARLSRGMNQSELARASGLTRAAISKWESNSSCSPDARATLAVAKALGVSVESLLE